MADPKTVEKRSEMLHCFDCQQGGSSDFFSSNIPRALMANKTTGDVLAGAKVGEAFL